jgi:hypothetical protein
MEIIKSDMEGGITSFIDKQKEVEGECTLTVAEFDERYDVLMNMIPIKKVEAVKINPRGMTALVDAACRFITETGNSLAELPEDQRPEKVIMIVVTDGMENASKQFTATELAEKIKHQEDIYKWEFIYLGANQDSFAVGGAYGYASAKMSNYKPTKASINKTFANLSEAAVKFRGGTADSVSFTTAQQKENEQE